MAAWCMVCGRIHVLFNTSWIAWGQWAIATGPWERWAARPHGWTTSPPTHISLEREVVLVLKVFKVFMGLRVLVDLNELWCKT